MERHHGTKVVFSPLVPPNLHGRALRGSQILLSVEVFLVVLSILGEGLGSRAGVNSNHRMEVDAPMEISFVYKGRSGLTGWLAGWGKAGHQATGEF